MKGEDLEGDENNKKYSLREGWEKDFLFLKKKIKNHQTNKQKKPHQQIQLDIIRQTNRHNNNNNEKTN